MATSPGVVSMSVLVNAMHEFQPDCTKTEIRTFLTRLFAQIAVDLAAGHKISIAKFGTFQYKTRHLKARMGRNPATGEELKLPAKTIAKIAFRASKALKDSMPTHGRK